jgi:hypothetical protein
MPPGFAGIIIGPHYAPAGRALPVQKILFAIKFIITVIEL